MFNVSNNDYGHMRDVQCIKQRMQAHERLSMNHAIIKGTEEMVNDSSNDNGNMRAVQ
jgi:hypothetical protein